MKHNYLSWLAMFVSAMAGTFCSQLASKYTDRKIESALTVSVALSGADSTTTVALNRDGSALGETAKN